MKRSIKISQFRNLGFEGLDEICINHNIDENCLGDLVILIGQNNSGKSNVLSAIEAINNKRLRERDITTLSYKESDRNPFVILSYSNHCDKCELKLSLKSVEPTFIQKSNNDIKLSEKQLLSEISTLKNVAIKYDMKISDYLSEKYNSLLDTKNVQEIYTSIIKYFKEMLEKNNYNTTCILKYANTQISFVLLKDCNQNILQNANNFLLTNYKIPFQPNIITYVEKELTSNSLECSISSLENSSLFYSLFKAIGVEFSEILEAYKEREKFKNYASLKKINTYLNEKIKPITEQFNKLYYSKNDKYDFSINLDKNSINLGISRGKDEDAIVLDYQSTGFKWFFNFYFNFIMLKTMERGDIILLDEPATHLHPKGQQELRAFIKQFAIDNGITFIISTHSPFLIDPDHFDELRIISMENNRSKIDNYFHAVNNNDPDTLLPIKEALTIKQNVFYDFDSRVIWVEGMTDYIILTTFKKLLNIKNLYFIPFNGVGNSKEMTQNILNKICKIKFFNAALLVDGDKAGKQMIDLAKNTLFIERITSYSDLSKNDKNIINLEDIFSTKDKATFACLDEKSSDYKKVNSYMKIKKSATLSSFSKETVDLFKKLFKLLDE